MNEHSKDQQIDVDAIVQRAVQEFMKQDVSKREPAYKAELQEERRRREQLERRLNEVVEENKRNRKLAEEADRSSTIRSELQQLGVTKIDLAYKAIQDGIFRTEDGRLVARSDSGEIPAKEYLTNFVAENPEFLPARIAGGASAVISQKPSGSGSSGAIDLDRISPTTDKAELERIRQEIVRVASQTLKNG